MLVQLHWQNRANLRETIMVSQSDVASNDDVRTWLNDVMDRRREEMPDGWIPMVCTEHSRHFEWAANL